MVKIKDFKEKKYILGYCKVRSRSNNAPIADSSVYANWIAFWKSDFKFRNKLLVLCGNKFIMKGIKAEFLKDYYDYLHKVTLWINDTYNPCKGKKNNLQHFEKILYEYKGKCAKSLNDLLEETGLEAAGYYFTHYSVDNPTKLSKFHLNLRLNEGKKFIKSGSYETMLEFINENKNTLKR